MTSTTLHNQAADAAFLLRAQIVAEAREWMGTPFHHQARCKGAGVDCVGLVIGVCKKLKLTDFDHYTYSRIPDGQMMKATCEANMARIPFAEIIPGDVILFHFGSHPQHLAIVGDHPHGGLSIIHSYAPSKKVVEMSLSQEWIDRIVACYRLPGVA